MRLQILMGGVSGGFLFPSAGASEVLPRKFPKNFRIKRRGVLCLEIVNFGNNLHTAAIKKCSDRKYYCYDRMNRCGKNSSCKRSTEPGKHGYDCRYCP